MRLFTQLFNTFVSPGRWSYQLFGKDITFHGGDIEAFLQKFEKLEDQVISLWENNHLTWTEYQNSIAEIQKAKQHFVWYAY